jgi:hypothetical protein
MKGGIMSFSNLNRKKLVEAADHFDVEIGEDDTRAQIITALEESNISWNNYKKFVEGNEAMVVDTSTNVDLPAPVQDDVQESNSNAYDTKVEAKDTEQTAAESVQFNKTVLLKMERKNATYQILGRRFTRDQPFQVMTEDEAQRIIDTAEREGGGFRIATPAEAKSYFG